MTYFYYSRATDRDERKLDVINQSAQFGLLLKVVVANSVEIIAGLFKPKKENQTSKVGHALYIAFMYAENVLPALSSNYTGPV